MTPDERLARLAAEMFDAADNYTTNDNHVPCGSFTEDRESGDDYLCATCRWPEDSHHIVRWASELTAIRASLTPSAPQTCETCRHEDVVLGTARICGYLDALAETYDAAPGGLRALVPLTVNGQPFGCRAYEPKEE